MIKAPFNFVPLNEEAYIAEWADYISQDIPFEDGISGTIRYTIEAKTPVFVNDGAEGTDVCEFCHVMHEGRKQYFIPGTSVKGMVKNVMEILSFGKMQQVQDQSFGLRDLGRGQDGIFYRNKISSNNVRCGWLQYENGVYFLEDCGIPWRISADMLDKEFRMGLGTFIRNRENFNNNPVSGLEKDEAEFNKTAQKKYKMFFSSSPGHDLKGRFKIIPKGQSGNNMDNRTYVSVEEGKANGIIVFTGQPGERKDREDRKSGKLYEFVFPIPEKKKIVPVSEEVFRSFDTIHQNSLDYIGSNETDEIPGYFPRKRQLNAGKKIPVFFLYDEYGHVMSMGLSYMFKYPAFNSVHKGIPSDLLKEDVHDLCECVFGFTGKKESLKGRVQFSPSLLTGQAEVMDGVRIALAKPHPSYYPLYLDNGQTWNSAHVRIAGRKRYPVRESEYPNEGPDNMTRTIKPLRRGSVFNGTIRVHNLRPIELGALLSAIDFCNDPNCCHSIGQGKPLGYGRVQVSISETDLHYVIDAKECNADEVRQCFCEEMENKFNGWRNRPQLTELFAMAEGIPSDMDDRFRYMQMSMERENNEFENARDEQFGRFSQILKLETNEGLPRISQDPWENIETLIEEAKEAGDGHEVMRLLTFAKAYGHDIKLSPEEKNNFLAEAKREEEAKAKKIAEGFSEKAAKLFDRQCFQDAAKLYELADSLVPGAYTGPLSRCKMMMAEDIAKEATERLQLQDYEKAAELFEQAQSLAPGRYLKQIKQCNDMLKGRLEAEELARESQEALGKGDCRRAYELIQEAYRLAPEVCGEALFREVEESWKRLSESEGIAAEAEQFFKEKRWKEARDSYQKAADFKFYGYEREIEECNRHIAEEGLAFADFISNVKLASINAFANNLKKRQDAGDDENIRLIIQKIKDDWSKLRANSNERKDWLNRKKWNAMENILGKEKADLIYEDIKDCLPLK